MTHWLWRWLWRFCFVLRCLPDTYRRGGLRGSIQWLPYGTNEGTAAMRWTEKLSELARRALMLFSKRERFDTELEEEMRLHRDLRAREFQKDGAESQAARDAAQRRFGNSLR